MLLHIGEEQNFYNSRICPQRPIVDVVNIVHINEKKPIVDTPFFSFFKSPITNTTPHSQTTLRQVYNAIKGNYYKARTEKLRSLLTSPLSCGEGSGVRSGEGQVVRQKFKAANFDYCTFSGTFTSRNDKALIKHSGLLCIDFDHLNSSPCGGSPEGDRGVERLFNRLLQDDYFDTQLLFRSPSGDGLKWIISIDIAKVAHVDYFLSISNYLKATYGIAVDKSGRDLSRACFLPFDPEVYINPIHLKQS